MAWRNFVNFAHSHNLPSLLPIPIDHLLCYITFLANKGRAFASLSTIVSAISYFHKLDGVPDPTKTFKFQQLLAALKRSHHSVDLRLPMTHDILKRILGKLDNSSLAHYERMLFKAMFLLAFHFGLRLGEITQSPHNLSWDSIILSSRSLKLTFQSFKHAVGPPVTHKVVGSGSVLCPVAAMASFLGVRGQRPGPLFLLGGAAVKRHMFNGILKSLLRQCGIQGRITSHSFRIGAATWWSQLNYSQTQIKRLGRWKSNAFLKYLRGPVVHPVG